MPQLRDAFRRAKESQREIDEKVQTEAMRTTDEEAEYIQSILREEEQETQFIGELNALKKCECLAKERPILIKPEIAAGDDVLIVSGPLEGLRTKVLRREDEQDVIVINLPILNTHIEYPLPAEELKKII